MERYDFESILLPINWVNIFNANFAPKVLEIAKSKGMGILALKAMAKTSTIRFFISSTYLHFTQFMIHFK